jgi:hypothetical protein
MVPVALAWAIVAPDGVDSATVRVSFASTVVSPTTGTTIVLEASPAAKVSVPDCAE